MNSNLNKHTSGWFIKYENNYYDKPKSTEKIMLQASDKRFQVDAFTHKSSRQLFPHDSNPALYAPLQNRKQAQQRSEQVCEKQRKKEVTK